MEEVSLTNVYRGAYNYVMTYKPETIKYMTLKEAADYIGWSSGALATYVYERGIVTPAVVIGNHPGFTQEQMDAFKNRPPAKRGRKPKEKVESL